MSQGLTPHQKERILGLHYSFFTNEQIAVDVGIASGRVSQTITEHKKSLADLTDYTEIRQITKFWKKSNLTIPDASKIIETNGILQNSGLTIHDLPKISQIVSLCDSKDISLELLVDASVQISSILAVNPDVSLSEIPSHSQKLIDENDTLQKQNAELIQSIKENKQTFEDTLQKNNTTLSHLESFNETQDYLKSVNIPIDSPEKLAVLLKSAKNEKYDVSKVIAHLNQKDSIQSQIKQLESKQKQLDDTIESKQKQLDDTIESKNSKIKSLDSQITTQESKFDSIKLETKNIQGAINNVKKLQKLGVTLNNIESWNILLSKAGIDLSQITASLNMIKSLLDTQDTLQQDIVKLKNTIASQQGEKSQLESQIKNLQAQQDTLLEFTTQIKQLFSELTNHSITLMSSSIDETGENFSKSTNSIMTQLQNQADTIITQSKSLAQYNKNLSEANFLAPLYRVILGQDVIIHDMIPILHIIIDKLIIYFKKQKSPDSTMIRFLENLNKHLYSQLIRTSIT